MRELWSRPPADLAAVRAYGEARREYELEVHAAEQWGGYFYDKPPPEFKARKLVGREDGVVLVLYLEVRCRKCPKCRKVRARMWYSRAMQEIGASARTWFGTITLNPETQHLGLCKARARMRRQGVEWEEMTPSEQYRELHRANGQYLQLWLKRVRKESGARIRFLLVAEAHKTGLPHYHALVHECDAKPDARRIVTRKKRRNADGPQSWESVERMTGWLTEEMLGRQWWREVQVHGKTEKVSLGFVKFELIDGDTPKRASYVCKYLSKSADARVRASARYGHGLYHSESVRGERPRSAPTHPEGERRGREDPASESESGLSDPSSSRVANKE